MPEKRSPARLVSGHFQQQQQASNQQQRPRRAVADSATSEEQCHPRKIFVGGLAHKTTTQHLRDYFGRFGSIVDAVVLRWPDGRSRGFGYVTFGDVNSASQALRGQHAVGGRQVDVKRAVPGTNKLFVGGLPQNTTATELREHFETFGVVSDAVVMMDPTTNRSRGFGFVCFLPGQEGAAAVASSLDNYQSHRLRGKWIEVKSAAPPHKLAPSKDGGSDGVCTPSDEEDDMVVPSAAYAVASLPACGPPGLLEPAKVTLASCTSSYAQVPITMATPPGLEGLPRAQKWEAPPIVKAAAHPAMRGAAGGATTLSTDVPSLGSFMCSDTWGNNPSSVDTDGLFSTSADLKRSLEQLLRLESTRKKAEASSKEPASSATTFECSSSTQIQVH